jgi:hypothetical protein
VELFDTSTDMDININEIMRSLIMPDEDLTPALPKVTSFYNNVKLPYHPVNS